MSAPVIEKFVDRKSWWHEVVSIIGKEEWQQGQWNENNEDVFETPSFRIYGIAAEGLTFFTICKRILG